MPIKSIFQFIIIIFYFNCGEKLFLNLTNMIKEEFINKIKTLKEDEVDSIQKLLHFMVD